MRIVYGLCGEGRGHCARFLAIAPLLDAEFLVFAGGDAYEFLDKQKNSAKAGIKAHFIEVPPLKFQYRNGKRDFLHTAVVFASTILKLKAHWFYTNQTIAEVEQAVADFNPDFIVNDDEPFLFHIKRLPPLVQFNRFGKIADCHPAPYRGSSSYALEKFINISIYRMLMHAPDYVITSSFYESEPLEKYKHKVTAVGPILRQNVLNQTVTDQGHVVVYATNPYVYTDALMEMIRDLPRKVYVYGSKETGISNNIEYCRLHSDKFVKHISSCAYAISTPGNMLLSEIRYLKKKILLLYTDSFEQRENIIWASSMGFAQQLNYKKPPSAAEVERTARSLKVPEGTKDNTKQVVEKILEICKR